MAKETKFNKMLNEDDEKRSSKAKKVSLKIKREARRELSRRKREEKEKQKRINKMRRGKSDVSYINPSLEDVKSQGGEIKTEEPILEPIASQEEEQSNTSSKTSKIDFNELKKVQEELRKEQGFEEPEVDYSYHKTVDEETEPSGQDELALSNPFDSNQEIDDSEEEVPFSFDLSGIEQKMTPEENVSEDVEQNEVVEEKDVQGQNNISVTMADGSPVPSNINLNISINIPEGVKSSETVIRQEGDFADTNINLSGNNDGQIDLTKDSDFVEKEDETAPDKKEIAEVNVDKDEKIEEDNLLQESGSVQDEVAKDIPVQKVEPIVNEEPVDEELDAAIEETNSQKQEDKNEHISKVSSDELEAIKRELAYERGEITEEEYLAGLNKDKKENIPVEENKPLPKEFFEDLDETNIIEESEETKPELQVEEEREENKALEEIKKAASQDDLIAPEESLPDSITDEDIEEHFQAQEEENQKRQEEEDSSEYTGMTEEEIALAKERKRKLQELKARYNTKENAQAGNEGDYRKNLDFSLNTSIKRFRVKPPKKPIIIAVASILAVFAIASVIAYFILNKPPEPIVMSSVRLSQAYTYQYVGDDLDIRGLYAECTYTDGSVRNVKLTEEMITRKSLNIDENNKILDYDDLTFEIPEGTSKSTFVYFTINGFEARLDIRITEINLESISAQLVGQSFTIGQVVSFENLLVLAKTETGNTIRINSKDCQLTIDNLVINSNDEGFMIPGDFTGEKTLMIEYVHNNLLYSTSVLINIKSI